MTDGGIGEAHHEHRFSSNIYIAFVPWLLFSVITTHAEVKAAAVIALVASILISPIYLAKFTNGDTLGLAAFVAAIIGGFNPVRGAILGGFVLGILDNLSAAYISAQYRGAFPLLLLIAGCGLSFAAAATAQDMGPAKVAQAAGGPALADNNGMTLYMFSRDTVGAR